MRQATATTFISEHLQQSGERRERIRKLEEGITELSAHIYAATFRLLEMIREYDECKGWSQPGQRSCAHWLNWKCGIGLGAALDGISWALCANDDRPPRHRLARGTAGQTLP